MSKVCNTIREAPGFLSLAATPTFASMALFTAFADGPAYVLCSSASPLGGMVLMYALMSAFHVSSWFQLVSNWQMPKREPRTL